MVKYMGLGIACLTLALSGVTRASIVQVDCGKYGKNDKKIECKDDHKGKEVCFDIKDIKCVKLDLQDIKCDLKDLKGDKGCKVGIDLKDIKDLLKDVLCKIDFDKHHEKNLCDIGQNDWDRHCDLVLYGCDHNHGPSCGDHTCAAVPAPASAATSGAGLLGIMLMGWLRSRRSVKA